MTRAYDIKKEKKKAMLSDGDSIYCTRKSTWNTCLHLWKGKHGGMTFLSVCRKSCSTNRSLDASGSEGLIHILVQKLGIDNITCSTPLWKSVHVMLKSEHGASEEIQGHREEPSPLEEIQGSKLYRDEELL